MVHRPTGGFFISQILRNSPAAPSSAAPDKGLLSRTYKEYTENSKIKKTNNPILKQAKDLNKYLTKEDIQMVNKHNEKMLNTVRYQAVANQNKESPL